MNQLKKKRPSTSRRPAERYRREVDRPHPESLSLLDDDRRDDRSS